MTATPSSTRALFREALALVRSYPLDPDQPPPALGGWTSTLPSTTPQRAGEEVAGHPGDLWSIAEQLQSGGITIADLAAESRSHIDRYSDELGAYDHVADTSADVTTLIAEARAGMWRSALHGVPISIKDVIHVTGMPTGGGSAAYPRRFAREEGLAVRRLREAGALFTGKVASHEFALGVTTPQSRNPWDARRIPGGSSGGSAISIVTGMSAASLGTDTRASIRVPAALSGTVGFKPSFGQVPAGGLLTLSWSMDHIAPMGRSVRDIALLMDVLTASPGTHRQALPGSVHGRRFVTSAALRTGAEPGVDRAFSAVLALLESLGATVIEGDRPTRDDLALANAAGMIVSRCEAATYHRDLGTDLERCTPETRDQLAEAEAVAAMDYVRAHRLRALLRERFVSALAEADALIMPTSKVLAPRVEHAGEYLLVLSENCIPWSFVDMPAISLPAGMVDGLPVGVQIVGWPGGDLGTLSLAHGLETLLDPLPAWQPERL
jgi:aspartyl-tRNA(Asn)/glutamyl-tRNA(Gln) amidotransferase subunit A